MNYAKQLAAILKAADWSQEQLARELHVSFPTLNAWINERSNPRKNALLDIERLYLTIVGADFIAEDELNVTKGAALELHTSVKKLAENRETLDKLALYLTYHTNTIEGSTMTLSDVEKVLFEHKVLSNRTAVEQAEARNHQAALIWVLDRLVKDGSKLILDEDFILGIHLRLMNGIMSDAGTYRKHSVRIMGTHVPLANWQKVPDLIVQLVGELGDASGNIVDNLAKTHAVFEKIHPFSDGNGRTGRLLLFAQALKVGLTPPLVTKERKFAYYKYLELAQTKGNYKPLELFIAQSMLFCHELLKS
jgi:Fic family protein/DNA-binding XRE family transcriptional regulator